MSPTADHNYFVYFVASRSRTLYCGVTKSLVRRVDEHRDGSFEGFSSVYKCNRLVWFERFEYIGNAIAREKQIKRWRRDKKLVLIDRMNPSWSDLSEAWRLARLDAGPSTALRSGRDDNSF